MTSTVWVVLSVRLAITLCKKLKGLDSLAILANQQLLSVQNVVRMTNVLNVNLGSNLQIIMIVFLLDHNDNNTTHSN